MYPHYLTLKSKAMKKQMNPDSYRDPGCGCGSGCYTGAMVD